jgi:7,8-dihydro-6-hydroxymethylpterin dimethyltransferase
LRIAGFGLGNLVRKTESVCPVCLERIPATIISRGQEYFLEKTCSVHGQFSTPIWRGNYPSLEQWGSYSAPAEAEDSRPDCPNGCGLCPGHLQKTCCAILEVTSRCNLSCSFCFAKGGQEVADPTLEYLSESFKELVKRGCTFVQLSGGEPTMRDDLPEIVTAAKSAGVENIQLNSNGIRLGADRAYTKALAKAGVSFVFMQFDGTEDPIYEKLRGRPLLAEKKAAIKACSDELMGVALVPTIVPGINDHNLGDILNFGISNSPAVRGVHFQPVSYLGRYPRMPGKEARITLPEVLCAIEQQTNGKLKLENFTTSSCDHPRCGFHGDFVVMPDKLLPLTMKTVTCACNQDSSDAHIKSRNFVARRWRRTAGSGAQACCGNDTFDDLDSFIDRIKSHGFTVTAMAFQDAYTFDIERLRRCSVHVYENGRLIPFCARYLTAEPGNAGDSPAKAFE